MNIVEIVKNKVAKFQYADSKNLWYITQDGFKFAVPFTSIYGVIMDEEPARRFIRQIRKQLEKDETK